MQRTDRLAFSLLCLIALWSFPHACRGQTPSDLKPEDWLQHQDLYLRGLWHGTKLAFDAAGKPLKEYPLGPVTLSGIDVLSMRSDHHRLFLHAAEVALVADASGRLQRHAVTNTTLMPGTLQKKYVARQELDILVDADSSGGFTTALHAIFARNLAELAPSVPSYWKCYASAYFLANLSVEQAREQTELCVQERAIPSGMEGAATTPPSVLDRQQPQFDQAAFEIHASGSSKVHVTITKAGYPVHLQVVEAVGAGLDEAALEAVSRWHFRPALKDGLPVLSQTDVTLDFQVP